MQLIGVLLAAGRSTRMGRPKQLLPWPPSKDSTRLQVESGPLVAAAFDAIARVCDAMVVVVGHEADAVLAALGGRKFQCVLVDSGAEMFASVQAGLQTAQDMDSATDVLLHLGDHPRVSPATLQALIQSATNEPDRAIMPVIGDAGGHPVLIPASLVRFVASYRGPGGLRQFWLDHTELCVRLPVDDPGVIFDVDFPSDYDVGVE